MTPRLLPLVAAIALFACTEEREPAANLAAVNEIAAAPDPGDADDGAEQAAGAGAAAGTQDEPIKDQASDPAGPPADEDDACGASRYQWLVGRPRSEIPARPSGANWRIACTGCPITMDYSPERMNIFYDAETERIDEVRCG